MPPADPLAVRVLPPLAAFAAAAVLAALRRRAHRPGPRSVLALLAFAAAAVAAAAGTGEAAPWLLTGAGSFFAALDAAGAVLRRVTGADRAAIEVRLLLGASDREAVRPWIRDAGERAAWTALLCLAAAAATAWAVRDSRLSSLVSLLTFEVVHLLAVPVLAVVLTRFEGRRLVRHGRLRDEDAAGARARFDAAPPASPENSAPRAFDRRPEREAEGGFPEIE